MLKNVLFFFFYNAHAEQVPGMLPFASRHIEGRILCFVTRLLLRKGLHAAGLQIF